MRIFLFFVLERITGLEPAHSAWEADALPDELNPQNFTDKFHLLYYTIFFQKSQSIKSGLELYFSEPFYKKRQTAEKSFQHAAICFYKALIQRQCRSNKKGEGKQKAPA